MKARTEAAEQDQAKMEEERGAHMEQMSIADYEVHESREQVLDARDTCAGLQLRVEELENQQLDDTHEHIEALSFLQGAVAQLTNEVEQHKEREASTGLDLQQAVKDAEDGIADRIKHQVDTATKELRKARKRARRARKHRKDLKEHMDQAISGRETAESRTEQLSQERDALQRRVDQLIKSQDEMTRNAENATRQSNKESQQLGPGADQVPQERFAVKQQADQAPDDLIQKLDEANLVIKQVKSKLHTIETRSDKMRRMIRRGKAAHVGLMRKYIMVHSLVIRQHKQHPYSQTSKAGDAMQGLFGGVSTFQEEITAQLRETKLNCESLQDKLRQSRKDRGVHTASVASAIETSVRIVELTLKEDQTKRSLLRSLMKEVDEYASSIAFRYHKFVTELNDDVRQVMQRSSDPRDETALRFVGWTPLPPNATASDVESAQGLLRKETLAYINECRQRVMNANSQRDQAIQRVQMLEDVELDNLDEMEFLANDNQMLLAKKHALEAEANAMPDAVGKLEDILAEQQAINQKQSRDLRKLRADGETLAQGSAASKGTATALHTSLLMAQGMLQASEKKNDDVQIKLSASRESLAKVCARLVHMTHTSRHYELLLELWKKRDTILYKRPSMENESRRKRQRTGEPTSGEMASLSADRPGDVEEVASPVSEEK